MNRRLAAIALLLAGAYAAIAGCTPKPLRARQVTAATAVVDLFGGTDATGGIGDWALTNGVVEAIIDDVGWQADVLAATGEKLPLRTFNAKSGGMLIDLGTFGDDNDQLAVLFPLFDYDPQVIVSFVPASEALGNPALGSIVPSVDTEAGIASLTVYGRVITVPGLPYASQPLAIRQIYSVRRNESFLRIRTEIQNDDPVETYTTVGMADLSILGPGGAAPFVPWPGSGFNILTSESRVPYVAAFGLNGPNDGPVHESGSATRGVSYAIAAPEDPMGPYVLSATTVGTFAAGSIPGDTPILPGGVFSWERRIYVGRRGDVDGAVRPALNAFVAAKGYPTGTIGGSIATADGSPFRASIEITQTDRDPATPEIETIVSDVGGVGAVPITQIRTDTGTSGGFETSLPTGSYTLRIQAEGRQPIGPFAFTVTAGAVHSLGTFTLSSNGSLIFEVRDAASNELVPGRLTIKGKTVADPRLGAPFEVFAEGMPILMASRAALPAMNNVYTTTGDGQVPLPPGDYRLIASRGPESDIVWQDVTVTMGATTTASFLVPRVVDTTGWLGADFHVHASPSADSSVPPRDRVATLAGEGLEVMVSSDHDMIFDYAPVIESMGAGAWIASMVGTEVTSNSGPEPFTEGFGHFNGWPMPIVPNARKNGSPEDDGVEPNVIYDRLRTGGARIVQMNHPEWNLLGFLSTLDYDPLYPISTPPNDYLLRTSVLGTGTRNIDLDAIELLNGLTFATYPNMRDIWMGLLDQGYAITATAASDTHRIALPSSGLPRTYVKVASDEPGSFDAPAFNDSLDEMHAIGTSGPFIQAELLHGGVTTGIGDTITATSGPVELHVRVQAPCWIPVGDLRIFANGTLYLLTDIATPTCTSAVRFDGTFTLTPSVDTHYVVETEERLPRDTSVFYKQVATYLYAGMTFVAFTNPLFVDVDGNGVFDPPGF